jgi:hypothetical protein
VLLNTWNWVQCKERLPQNYGGAKIGSPVLGLAVHLTVQFECFAVYLLTLVQFCGIDLNLIQSVVVLAGHLALHH